MALYGVRDPICAEKTSYCSSMKANPKMIMAINTV